MSFAGYRRKYLFGFLPFWPTQRVGFYAAVLAAEVLPVLRGQSGRRYLRQSARVLGQLPRAVAAMVADECSNIWRSRLNRRFVEDTSIHG